jgi:pimeloyl-ACP methyl ester carboxylesterase
MKRVRSYLNDYAYAMRLGYRGLFNARDDSEYLGGDRAPVVLLPGVYEPWTFLRPLAARVHSLGHPVHVVRRLGRNTRSVPTAAARAQTYIDEHDLRHVVLLAHSKGGLIGKHMMLLDDADGRIDRLVAIATPFGGTRYARYMLDPTLRAFRPTEKTLAMLAANALVNPRIVSIYGDDDTHIPEGCELPGATNLEFPIVGHFRVLADEEVLAAVDAAVGA